VLEEFSDAVERSCGGCNGELWIHSGGRRLCGKRWGLGVDAVLERAAEWFLCYP